MQSDKLLKAGYTPYKPAHKVSRYRATLAGVRSINRYFRESDKWWVSPDGKILHVEQMDHEDF